MSVSHMPLESQYSLLDAARDHVLIFCDIFRANCAYRLPLSLGPYTTIAPDLLTLCFGISLFSSPSMEEDTLIDVILPVSVFSAMTFDRFLSQSHSCTNPCNRFQWKWK